MNLHVTNDIYGLYTLEIAERINNSDYKNNNIIINLSETVTLKDESVVYIPITDLSFKNYINKLQQIDKVVFHPYNFTSYEFLKILLKKFPDMKIYWVCWSYEFYNLPHVVNKLYDPFSFKYIRSKISFSGRVKKLLVNSIIELRGWIGLKKNYWQKLRHASSLPDYFCTPFPSDFNYLNQIITQNHLLFEPFSYLSLNKIMPQLDSFSSKGNKIMIGHSSSPDGNHYEVIKMISSINNNYPILMPLAYGDKEYASVISKAANTLFKNVEILEDKIERSAYYRKLCEVGWAVINVKVQQGVGNIIGLIWIGAKVFLDKRSSVYIDFNDWGIKIFNIQDHLNKEELETKLAKAEIENNRRIILDNFGEKKVSEYWKKILT